MTAANTYGRQVVLPMTNKSGGGVVAGDVVVVDTTNNLAFTTTTSANFTGLVGVAQETIASNAVGRVLLSGYAALVNVNASVTRGHFGATFTVAKQATDVGTSRGAGTFCQFMTGGTTPDAVVYPVDLLGSSLTNPMSAQDDMIVGGALGVPARLAAAGAASKFLQTDGSNHVTWGDPVAGLNFTSFYPGISDPTALTGTWVNQDFSGDGDKKYPFGNKAYYNSTEAQNDALSWDLWMEAGTYTFTAYFRKSTNTAILTINLDGASQGTIDTYAAAVVYGNGSVSSIAVTAGKRTWQVKAATKNGSSGGYAVELFGIVIRRTA